MKRVVAAIVLACATLASCSGGGGFEGTWKSTFGGVTLDLKPDHTVDLSVVGIGSEGTWESVSKDQIIVHGRHDMTLTRNEDGDLTDGMGGRFVKQK